MKKDFLLFIITSILFGIGVENDIPVITGVSFIAIIVIVVRELLLSKIESQK